jgi:hypothetical protein
MDGIYVEIGQCRHQLIGPAAHRIVLVELRGQRLAGHTLNSSDRSLTLASSHGPSADGPSRMKVIHPRSVAATCLIRPPRHSSLAVLRLAACSSVRPRTV